MMASKPRHQARLRFGHRRSRRTAGNDRDVRETTYAGRQRSNPSDGEPVSRLYCGATGADELDVVGGASEYVVGVSEDLPWSGDVEQVRAGHGEEPDAFLRAGHEISVFVRVLKCNYMAMSAKLRRQRWSRDPFAALSWNTASRSTSSRATRACARSSFDRSPRRIALHNPDEITIDDAAIEARAQHGGRLETRAESLQTTRRAYRDGAASDSTTDLRVACRPAGHERL